MAEKANLLDMIEQVVKLDLTIPALPEALEIPSVEIPEIHTEEGSSQGGGDTAGRLPSPPSYDLPSPEEHDFPAPDLPEAEPIEGKDTERLFSPHAMPADNPPPSGLFSSPPEWDYTTGVSEIHLDQVQETLPHLLIDWSNKRTRGLSSPSVA